MLHLLTHPHLNPQKSHVRICKSHLNRVLSCEACLSPEKSLWAVLGGALLTQSVMVLSPINSSRSHRLACNLSIHMSDCPICMCKSIIRAGQKMLTEKLLLPLAHCSSSFLRVR